MGVKVFGSMLELLSGAKGASRRCLHECDDGCKGAVMCEKV